MVHPLKHMELSVLMILPFASIQFTTHTLSNSFQLFYPLFTASLSNDFTQNHNRSLLRPLGSGRGSSACCLVFLSATFGRFACPQVVRRLRSSAAPSNARFPSRRLAPKPLVTGCFSHSTVGPSSWLLVCFAGWKCRCA